MTKHPLLPDNYLDSAVHGAILFALGPYKITDRVDISNPQLKWDLHRAWQDAELLLAKSRWEHKGDEERAEYELSADAEHEIERLNVVLAGIVACQILDPAQGFFIQRIDHRRGGEMALIVSAAVAEKLKERFPTARFVGMKK